jgi:hypothetical protein
LSPLVIAFFFVFVFVFALFDSVVSLGRAGYRVIKRVDTAQGIEAYLQLEDGGNFYGKDLPLLHLQVTTDVRATWSSRARALTLEFYL